MDGGELGFFMHFSRGLTRWIRGVGGDDAYFDQAPPGDELGVMRGQGTYSLCLRWAK